MKIDELKAYAEEHGPHTLKFKFTDNEGKEFHCHWLDAYFGLFEFDDVPGFITVDTWKRETGDLVDLTIVE